MSKLLLIVAVGVIVYIVVSGANRRRQRGADRQANETMVPCAHCGVNFPRSEGIEAAGRFFCSDEHRRLGSR